jgi:hypothetical protein
MANVWIAMKINFRSVPLPLTRDSIQLARNYCLLVIDVDGSLAPANSVTQYILLSN